jgi:hypothetical protein
MTSGRLFFMVLLLMTESSYEVLLCIFGKDLILVCGPLHGSVVFCSGG